jgi:hypothetical protein
MDVSWNLKEYDCLREVVLSHWGTRSVVVYDSITICAIALQFDTLIETQTTIYV